jgi:hypothetical protein
MNIFQKQLMLDGRPLALHFGKNRDEYNIYVGRPLQPKPCSIEEFERDMRKARKEDKPCSR